MVESGEAGNNNTDNALEQQITTSIPTEQLALIATKDSIQVEEGEFVLKQEVVKTLEEHGLKLVRRLGAGAYGTVQLVFSQQLNKQIALKILDTTQFPAQFAEKFFPRELELIRTMQPHPRVIKFYGVFEDEYYCYIMMDLAPNGDLFDFLKKRSFIPEKQAAIWFRQLLQGVAHVHQQGYAHRDLKCEV